MMSVINAFFLGKALGFSKMDILKMSKIQNLKDFYKNFLLLKKIFYYSIIFYYEIWCYIKYIYRIYGFSVLFREIA